MQTKPFSNSPFRNARDAFLPLRWKGQHVCPIQDTTCRFIAIFEKPSVALGERIFNPSALHCLLRVASSDQNYEELEKMR
jgi:hypothetical protein